MLQSQELVLLERQERYEQEPAQLEVYMERQPVFDDHDARSDRHDRDVDEVRVIRRNTLPIR